MIKKILLASVAAASALFFFFFSLESDFLKHEIEKTLVRSGFRASIKTASFRLPVKIHIEYASIENDALRLSSPDIVLSVSPINFLIKRPFVTVSLKSPALVLHNFPSTVPSAGELPMPVGRIKIENGSASHRNMSLKNIYADVTLSSDGLAGLVKATEKNTKIHCSVKGRSGDIHANIVADDIKLSDYTGLDVPYTGKLTLKTKVTKDSIQTDIKGSVEKIAFAGSGSYGGGEYALSIDWSHPSEIYPAGNIAVSGKDGKFDFRVDSDASYLAGWCGFESGTVSLHITTSAVKLPFIDGTAAVKLDASAGPSGRTLSADVSCRIKSEKDHGIESKMTLVDDVLTLRGRMQQNVDTLFEIKVKDFKSVKGEIVQSKKSRILITGGLFPVNISFKSENWDIQKTPFLPFSAKGLINIDGDFTLGKNDWLLSADVGIKNFSWDDVKLEDLSAKIRAGKMFFSVSGNYLSGKLNGSYKNIYGKRKEFNFTADEASLAPLSIFLRKTVSGIVTGSVNLISSGGVLDGDANIKAQKVVIDKASIGDAAFFAKFSGNNMAVENLQIKNNYGEISGGVSVVDGRIVGVLHFDSYSTDGAFGVSGKIIPSGDFKSFDDFRAEVKSDNFSIDGIIAHSPMKMNIYSDARSVKLTDLRFNGIKDANVSVSKLSPNIITGDVRFNDYDISQWNLGLSGFLNGTARIEGTVASPRLTAKYEITKLNYGDYLSNGSLNGRLTTGKNTALVYDTSLKFGNVTADLHGNIGRVLGLTAEVRSPDVSSVLPAGVNAGKLKANILLKGPFASPSLSASGEIKGLDIGGQVFERIVFDGGFSGGVVDVRKVTCKFSGNEISVEEKSRINVKNKTFDINLLSSNFKAGIISILGRINLKGSYHLEPLKIEGAMQFVDLWIGEKKFSREVFNYTLDKKKFSLESAQNLDERLLFGIGFSDGEKTLKVDYAGISGRSLSMGGIYGPTAMKIGLKAANMPADTIAKILNLPYEINGNFNASAEIAGDPQNPKGDLTATLYNGSFASVLFDEISAELSFKENIMTVKKFSSFRKNAYRISANGYFPVALSKTSSKKIASLPNNLTIVLDEANLSFLDGVAVFKKASGPVIGKLELKGTHSSPKLTGFLKVENAYAELTTYLAKVNNFNFIVNLRDNVLTIENFSGRSGIGRFLLTGTILFENFAPTTTNLVFENTTKTGIDLFVPELPIPTQFSKETGARFTSSSSYGKPKFRLNLTGNAQKKLTLSGWVELHNTYFSYPPPPSSPADDPLEEILKRIDLDLQLKTGENTWYENELVSTNIDGMLTLKGGWYNPSVTGAVESKRGYISYIGTEFKIKTARLEVVNDEAYLEGVATKTIQTEKGYDTIQIVIEKSPIGKIQPRFLSSENPSLPSEKVLARVLGIDMETVTPRERDILLRQGLVRLLDSSLATPLAKNLLRRSGIIDLMKVSYDYPYSDESQRKSQMPAATFTELLKGTKYTMEKYVTDTMLLGYSVILDEHLNKLDLKHEIEVAYRLQGNVFVKGLYELGREEYIRPADRRVTIEFQKRFGWPKK